MMQIKMPRSEMISKLMERDGDVCAFPGCDEPLDLDAVGKYEVTIDHWIPQAECRRRGWTFAQIWSLSNLTLMTKKCNAKKGNRVPNPDGTLPMATRKQFRYRRDKRAYRPEVCNPCQAGRNLGPNEVCASCGSGPMPERFPRWAKVKAPECDHELFWCWACSIGIVERTGATEMIMVAGEGGDNE